MSSYYYGQGALYLVDTVTGIETRLADARDIRLDVGVEVAQRERSRGGPIHVQRVGVVAQSEVLAFSTPQISLDHLSLLLGSALVAVPAASVSWTGTLAEGESVQLVEPPRPITVASNGLDGGTWVLDVETGRLHGSVTSAVGPLDVTADATYRLDVRRATAGVVRTIRLVGDSVGCGEGSVDLLARVSITPASGLRLWREWASIDLRCAVLDASLVVSTGGGS